MSLELEVIGGRGAHQSVRAPFWLVSIGQPAEPDGGIPAVIWRILRWNDSRVAHFGPAQRKVSNLRFGFLLAAET